jgi:hypothetical protein
VRQIWDPFGEAIIDGGTALEVWLAAIPAALSETVSATGGFQETIETKIFE